MSQHKEQQGFLTFAINTPETNYLELAYLQCLNVKATQKQNSYAVIVDDNTYSQITDRHLGAFDYVIALGTPKHAFQLEPYVFYHTPFKETIKLESDLLFTRSIDHWWTAFRLKNVCLSHGTKTYTGISATVRKYRELFDDNNLPDIYNGLMYFRYSQEAAEFFRAAQHVSNEWKFIKPTLQKCIEDTPSTDVMYALAALMVGEETVTMPSMDFINFAHMKSGLQGWSDSRSWLDTVMNERDGDVIRINNINQLDPVHYYDKTYCTEELIKYYESRASKILSRS